MSKRTDAAYAKFKRLAVLNEMQDNGEPAAKQAAGRAKKALANVWLKRNSTNTKGFYDPRKASK